MGFNQQIFIERLKSLRQEKNLNQQKLAQALNVSRAALGHWEAGSRTPDLGIIAALSSFFGCNPAYLLGFTDLKDDFLSFPFLDMMINSDIPMYITTTDSENRLRFIWVNYATLNILGYEREEFLKLDPLKICDQICLGKIEENLSRLDKEKRLEAGWIHVCKEGKRIPLNTCIHKINTPSNIYYLSFNYYILPI